MSSRPVNDALGYILQVLQVLLVDLPILLCVLQNYIDVDCSRPREERPVIQSNF